MIRRRFTRLVGRFPEPADAEEEHDGGEDRKIDELLPEGREPDSLEDDAAEAEVG